MILKQNWALRPGSVGETARALFYGICVAFLGVTGMTGNISDLKSYNLRAQGLNAPHPILRLFVQRTTLQY